MNCWQKTGELWSGKGYDHRGDHYSFSSRLQRQIWLRLFQWLFIPLCKKCHYWKHLCALSPSMYFGNLQDLVKIQVEWITKGFHFLNKKKIFVVQSRRIAWALSETLIILIVLIQYKLLKVKPLRSQRARQKSCMLSLYSVILLEQTLSLLLSYLFVSGLMKHWSMVHLQTEPKHWWMMTDHGYQAQQNPPWAAQLPLPALCRKGLEILHLPCGSLLRMCLRN